MSKNKEEPFHKTLFEEGRDHYESINYHAKNKDVEKYKRCSEFTVDTFWFALVMGSYEAPYALFAMFVDGIGVEENLEIALVMLGISRKLNHDKSYKEIVIPTQLNPLIDKMHKLVVEAHNNPDCDEGDNLLEQIQIFENAAILPDNDKIVNYLPLRSRAINNPEEITQMVSQNVNQNNEQDPDQNAEPNVSGETGEDNQQGICGNCVIL